jgi:hypothetical protein
MYPVLADILLNGEGDIPTFFGGAVDHDVYYPDSGVGRAVDQKDLGEGCLLFDFKGMMRRQKVAKGEFESRSEKEEKEGK